MENQTLTEINTKSINEIKEKLPWNSYAILSRKLNNKYKPRTIEAMFNHHRKMKVEVFEAAREFVSLIDPD